MDNLRKTLGCLLLFLFAAVTSTYAQVAKQYSGTVTDADSNEPVIGVNVTLKDAQTGTVTDLSGKFSISAPVGSTLLFSYIGYVTKEVKLGTNTSLKITMQEDQNQLSEVVVIGYGGEIGHMTVDPFDDRVCNCGKTGCLELYASATGIVYETKKALKDFKEATTLRDLDEVTAKDIFDAAKEGDTFAKERVDDLGQKLALAAGNIALMVDPEVFVIGGGVSRAGQILLDAVNAHFKKYTFGKAQETGFVLATLGNDAGIYGAASLMLS